MENKNQAESKCEKNEDAKVLYKLVYDIGLKRFDYELQRESIISEQSKNIQTIFSILSVALLTVLPVIIEHSKILMKYILLLYVLVFIPLILSFIFSCIIQIRKKKHFWMDIEDIERHVSENYSVLVDETAQIKWLVDNYKIIQKDFSVENNKNFKLINLSNIMILTSISILILGFLIINILK